METKRKYVKWNRPKAINTVKRCVKESPGDLKVAFEKAATELNTTVAAVYQAWNNNIKHSTRGFSNKRAKATSNFVMELPSPAVEVVPQEQEQVTNGPIYETIVSTKEIEGMRVVTIRQYFAI